LSEPKVPMAHWLILRYRCKFALLLHSWAIFRKITLLDEYSMQVKVDIEKIVFVA